MASVQTSSILAEQNYEPLLFILVAAVVLGGIIYGYYAAKKRREAIAAWAQSKGFTFDSGQRHGMDDRYPQFDRLRTGDRRYAYNVSAGTIADCGVCAFDYHYQTYTTNSKGRRTTHHHYFSAVIIDADLSLKPLFIRPEGLFDKITEFVGFDDIDFELSEFSRKFYVKSPDRKWAFDVLHQATMEFMLGQPTFKIEFGGRCVMAYRTGKWDVPVFDEAVTVVTGILDRFPTYLLRELKGEIQ